MDYLQVMINIVAIFIFRLEFGSANCTRIETPENGRVVNMSTFENGPAIEFECNPGYKMLGQGKMICQADGQWNPSKLPTCEVIPCGDFGLILHGNFTFQDGLSTIGTRDSFVHVTCNPGYILDGPLRVMCQADGTWGNRPKCIPSNCPPYQGFNSSCIDISAPQGKFLFYVCRKDVSVTRTDQDSAECTNGNWDDTDLMGCFCDCKINSNLSHVSLKNAENGYIKHEAILEWSCEEGYKKNVTQQLICKDGHIGTPACMKSETKRPEEALTWMIPVVIAVYVA